MHKNLISFNIWVIALLSVWLTSSPSAEAGNLGELQEGTFYRINCDYQAWEATFTPQTSGILTVKSIPGLSLIPYSDAAHKDLMPYEGNFNSGGFQYTVEVEAGQPVYFYLGFSLCDYFVKLEMDEPVTLLSSSIEEGLRLTYGGHERLDIELNIEPSVDGVELECMGETVDLTPWTIVMNNVVGIMLEEPLRQLLNEHPGWPGNPCAVRLTGLSAASNPDNLYGGDGVLTLNYIMGVIPGELVWTNAEDFTFRSFYAQHDPAAVVTMTFDGELMPGAPHALLRYGDPYSTLPGEIYLEDLPAKVNGCSLTVDFSSRRREPSDMVSSGRIYSSIILEVYNIATADGELVYSPQIGHVGSFQYELPYEVVSGIESLPADDASLKPDADGYYRFYDLCGRLVLTTGDVDSVRNQLPAGVYVNGRGVKLIIRRP